MSRYVMALDQGTTSSRAILFDRDGQPGRQRTVDAIAPAVVLRIRVVGIEQHALAGTESSLREP